MEGDASNQMNGLSTARPAAERAPGPSQPVPQPGDNLLLRPQSVGAGETDSLDGLTSRCATRAEARRTRPSRTTTGSTPRQRPPLLLPPASTRPSRRGAGRTSRAQLRRGGGASRAPRLTEMTADPTRRRRLWKRVPQLAPRRPPSHRRRAPARRPAQAARPAPRRRLLLSHLSHPTGKKQPET